MENLWHYLRAITGRTGVYRDYDALQEEAVRSLCAVREDTETIKTVCNPRYISRAHIKYQSVSDGDRSVWARS